MPIHYEIGVGVFAGGGKRVCVYTLNGVRMFGKVASGKFKIPEPLSSREVGELKHFVGEFGDGELNIDFVLSRYPEIAYWGKITTDPKSTAELSLPLFAKLTFRRGSFYDVQIKNLPSDEREQRIASRNFWR